MNEHIKIMEVKDPVLKLGVTVILPVNSRADEDMLRDLVANLGEFSPMSLGTELRSWFGDFAIGNVREVDYPGMPWDKGMPPDAVPHPPGFWMDYWMSMGDDSSGSGSESYGSHQEETLVVYFRVAFYDYDSEDWLMVGRDFLRILSNIIGALRPDLSSAALTCDLQREFWATEGCGAPFFEFSGVTGRVSCIDRGSGQLHQSARAVRQPQPDS